MNRFVDILNRIRQNVRATWLTGSQHAAYDLLRERLAFLDEVNLWGGYGTGKTFIGWVLRSTELADYAPRLAEVGQMGALHLQRTVVVDNLGWRRAQVRQALHLCRSYGYEKVVLITSEPAHEQMAIVELSLNREDLSQVATNLRSIGVPPYTDRPRNLWDLVSPVELTREGGM